MPRLLRDAWRRRFGRYEIVDPRPVAAASPYTFFLPSEDELLALAPDDLAKITIRSIPNSRDWDAERMWVTVTSVDGDRLQGALDNSPCDIPQLQPGAQLAFKRTDVIDIQWATDRKIDPPPPAHRRQYWERCIVDDCVVEGRSKVAYLYRESPDPGEPDGQDPDSGWRIRGTAAAIDEDEAAGRSPVSIALGKVLNADDEWLPLIDAPIGACFGRDESGGFVALDDVED